MQVDFAFLCDSAVADGKLHALGIGIDVIYARQVPAAHPYFMLVAQVRVSMAELGTKDLSVRLIDDDGRDVVTAVQTQLAINQPAPGNLEANGRMLIAFNNVTFPRYGSYSMHLVMQGNEVARLPLRVVPSPQAAPQQ